MKAQSRIDACDPVSGDELEPSFKLRSIGKPEDQMLLTEAEMKEEVTRILTDKNPQLADNLVEYSQKDSCFVSVPHVTNAALLYNIQSIVVLKESEDADPADASQRTKSEDSESSDSKEAAPEEELEAEDEGPVEDNAGDAEEEEKDDGRKGSEADAERCVGSKKITNQFNFCERAAMTLNNKKRNIATQTIPPPRDVFAKQISQYTIYDGYQEGFENQRREKEKDKKGKAPQPQSLVAAAPMKREFRKSLFTHSSEITTRMAKAARILERMINQNIFDDIAQDYRFWEDPSDEYREEEGTLLPLWKFSYERTKRGTITSLCWNPRYYDMFAVAYGTFDFMRPQPDGAVCLYTLKNPSHPEYLFITDNPVMCIDIHPLHPHLFVIGRNDGNVAVYNVLLRSNHPQYRSNSLKHKHATIVWQVKWGKELPDGEINFFSISADGFVHNWIITAKDLAKSTVIPLVYDVSPIPGPDGITVNFKGCGTALAFHPTQPLIFLVGTEEGYIHKCSTAYTSMFLMTYTAHHMPIHRIDYNKFYPDIFISCSADWRIKMWEDNRTDPLFVFDVGSPIGDVEWSPYSSTVFACVTNDGKVHVFDININKYKPICSQSVVSRKRNKLTRLSFNFKLPIIIVGDDRGCVITLKLSPNLRKKMKSPKKGPPIESRVLEIQKLEKILALVRDPRQHESKMASREYASDDVPTAV